MSSEVLSVHPLRENDLPLDEFSNIDIDAIRVDSDFRRIVYVVHFRWEDFEWRDHSFVSLQGFIYVVDFFNVLRK